MGSEEGYVGDYQSNTSADRSRVASQTRGRSGGELRGAALGGGQGGRNSYGKEAHDPAERDRETERLARTDSRRWMTNEEPAEQQGKKNRQTGGVKGAPE